MKIHLIAIGQRMPSWVDDAYKDYAKRLPADYQLTLTALPAEKRHRSSVLSHIIEKESGALLNACPPHTLNIALERQGRPVNTVQLAQQLNEWHDQAQDIALLIGGPEGISKTVLSKTHTQWSLSKLTLAHPFVRVLIAEQIYRAWSILSSHPYHR